LDAGYRLQGSACRIWNVGCNHLKCVKKRALQKWKRLQPQWITGDICKGAWQCAHLEAINWPNQMASERLKDAWNWKHWLGVILLLILWNGNLKKYWLVYALTNLNCIVELLPQCKNNLRPLKFILVDSTRKV